MDILSDRIRELSLSKTEKRIADYLIVNQDSIGLSTALDLAREIGTSDTSLIRFVHRMGYPSFSVFKREMGSQLVNNSRAMRSSNKYAKSQIAADGDVIGEVYERALENIRKTCTELDQQRIHEVADILIRSHTKYICAFRTAQACATYMSGKLAYFLPHVVNIGGVENNALESLIDATNEDCLLMYSFPMYSEVNTSLLEIAQQRGTKSILVTDQVTSPLASKADIVLPASIAGLGFTNSYIAPMCLSEILLFTVSGETDIQKSRRAQQIDYYLDRHKLY